MRSRRQLAVGAGALAVVAALVFGRLRGRRSAAAPPAVPDPRAEELRRKLQQSRELLAEREEFESAETPVDQAEPGVESVEERRRRVHVRGRAAADEMRAADDTAE